MADSVSEYSRWSGVRQYLRSVTGLPHEFRPIGLNTFHTSHAFPVRGCQECEAERTSRYATSAPSPCTGPAIDWLMDPEQADPSIRWQVMRDLLAAPEAEWVEERARVETVGWGARLLAAGDEEGGGAGGAHVAAGDNQDGSEEGQPWTSMTDVLSQLREFGVDPAAEVMRRTVELIGENVRRGHAGEAEPRIDGLVVANGSYFGVDMSPVVDRLVRERLEDGSWNCKATNWSVESAFDTTVDVLEGLLEFERATGGTPASREARRTGEEYLLGRHLFRSTFSDPRYLLLRHPNRWHYDVVRVLDYFRASAILTGTAPDPRLGEAIEHVRSRRLDDGRWPLDWNPAGRTRVDADDGDGQPSRWATLRALRVLKWWENARPHN